MQFFYKIVLHCYICTMPYAYYRNLIQTVYRQYCSLSIDYHLLPTGNCTRKSSFHWIFWCIVWFYLFELELKLTNNFSSVSSLQQCVSWDVCRFLFSSNWIKIKCEEMLLMMTSQKAGPTMINWDFILQIITL